MAGLSSGDIAALAQLNIRVIFDLRNSAERAMHPTPWQALGVASYDHGGDQQLSGDLLALMTDPSATPAQVRSLMLQLYRELPFDHAANYRAIMLHIADGQLPLVFHCSAGKNRTGVLAALIMRLLDIDETAVMHDYLLTNDENHRTSALFARSPGQEMPKISEDLLVPLLRAALIAPDGPAR